MRRAPTGCTHLVQNDDSRKVTNIMSGQGENQSNLPQNPATGEDDLATTGDEHLSRPGAENFGEGASQEGMAGQGTGQIKETSRAKGRSGGGQKNG